MQMFDLVENFEYYPDFLPFCTRAISRPIGADELHGTLFINKGPFKKSFTTHNKMYRDSVPPYIDIKLVNGPFKQLEGYWRFVDGEAGCEVTLDLTYDMKSGLLNHALSSVFDWIAVTMVDAFCEQAHKIYEAKN